MRRNLLLIIICIITFLPFNLEAFEQSAGFVWKDMSHGVEDVDMKTIVVNPKNSDVVFAGSESSVYRTIDGGRRWENVFSFKATGNSINSIIIDKNNPEKIYLCTNNGLYRSVDMGEKWQRLFSGVGEFEGNVLSVAIVSNKPESILVGTVNGIFISHDGGGRWNRVHGISSRVYTTFLITDPKKAGTIYAATGKGVLKSVDDGKRWKRIFSIYGLENGEGYADNGYQQSESETDGFEPGVRSIVIDPQDNKTIYLGTRKGLFISKDGGISWKGGGASGLLSYSIRTLLMGYFDPGVLYAATDGGVFRYLSSKGVWEELYKGLSSRNVRYISSNHDSLWAATEKGVVMMVKNDMRADSASLSHQNINMFFTNEPTIEEIQKAAIDFAEVQPDKIKRWRKSAAIRALLPDLKFSYDKGRDWGSSGYFYGGLYKDDDVTIGKDSGWSVSATWELGDLIWNNDQTSIDSRSKLMVQLRDDVLNEVTRLYFERKRVKLKLLLSPYETGKEKMEDELRLEELTAQIDALTGFYLSKRLGRK